MTEAPDTPTEIDDEDLDAASAGSLLLPAVQSAGNELATPPKKIKVWPWHFW